MNKLSIEELKIMRQRAIGDNWSKEYISVFDELIATREMKVGHEPVGIFVKGQISRHVSWLSGASRLQSGDRLFSSPQEMKGDQAPVALVDERQGSGGFCLTQHGRRLKLPHGTELFTAPQKPVMLPEKSINDYNRYWIDYQDTVAAIEAAGGVVKDGA